MIEASRPLKVFQHKAVIAAQKWQMNE